MIIVSKIIVINMSIFISDTLAIFNLTLWQAGKQNQSLVAMRTHNRCYPNRYNYHRDLNLLFLTQDSGRLESKT